MQIWCPHCEAKLPIKPEDAAECRQCPYCRGEYIVPELPEGSTDASASDLASALSNRLQPPTSTDHSTGIAPVRSSEMLHGDPLADAIHRCGKGSVVAMGITVLAVCLVIASATTYSYRGKSVASSDGQQEEIKSPPSLPRTANSTTDQWAFIEGTSKRPNEMLRGEPEATPTAEAAGTPLPLQEPLGDGQLPLTWDHVRSFLGADATVPSAVNLNSTSVSETQRGGEDIITVTHGWGNAIVATRKASGIDIAFSPVDMGMYALSDFIIRPVFSDEERSAMNIDVVVYLSEGIPRDRKPLPPIETGRFTFRVWRHPVNCSTVLSFRNRGYDFVAAGEIDLIGRDEIARANAARCDARGDLQGAVAFLSEALAVNETDAKTFQLRGETYLRLGNREKARGDFVRAREIDPSIRNDAWEVRRFVGPKKYLSGLAVSPDGTKIATADGVGNCIWVWNVTDRRVLNTFKGHAGTVEGIVFSRDGKSLISGSWDETVRVWDVATGLETRQFSASGFVYGVAVSSDGKVLAAASDNLHLWYLDGRALRRIKGVNEQGYLALTFSADGARLFSSGWDLALRSWEWRKGSENRPRFAGDVKCASLAVSPDSRLLAGGGENGTICVWDTTQKGIRMELTGHSDWVRCVSFCPGGCHLGSGASDGSVRLWDMATGKEIRCYLPKSEGTTNGHVRGVAFLSGEAEIASVTDDEGWVRVWDTGIRPSVPSGVE